MGKKGDLLRAQKAQKAVYKFTGEQLRKRDEAMKEVWFEERKLELEERVNKLWNEREAEFKSGDAAQDMDTIMSYLLSVSCRVLIERFGWKPIIKGHRTKTQIFAEKVLEEVEKIAKDKKQSIHKYAYETDKLYGIQFVMTEDEKE